jgi:hypothetical protein
MKIGRDMGYTSKEVKKIFTELRKGNFEYNKSVILCPKKCRAGWRFNVLTGKTEDCPVCEGYGFVRLN